MTARTVVVNRHDGIVVVFGQCADYVRHTLLHLGVGTLHGIKLNARGILSGLDRRYGSAAHADAIVVTAHHHHGFARFGHTLDGILGGCIAYAAGEHDYLVIGIHLAVFVMLECEQRTADEGLAIFVAEVRRTV